MGRCNPFKSLDFRMHTTNNKAKEKFKKAPMAPRRFKTAYMFFSIEKQKEIRGSTGEKVRKSRLLFSLVGVMD
jgi:hypothetical protein